MAVHNTPLSVWKAAIRKAVKSDHARIDNHRLNPYKDRFKMRYGSDKIKKFGIKKSRKPVSLAKINLP